MTADHPERPRRLAVVDDNAEFRAIVRAVAEPLHWEVSEFENGKRFIAAVTRDLHPDLVMLDMVMPEMDGIETIGALAASSVRCPIILITGRLPLYTQTADELARAHGLEIVKLMQKPFSVAEMRAELTRVVPDPGS